ncbi:alpha/beta hydrolase [Kribbella sp. NPDC056861]|uniref:alpha/beta fold hydrolase n=1 Tax=Kribbella sp. NPDC056861 TaxID=3154857 RepID=UPI0034240617
MKDLVCLHAAGSSPATWDEVLPGLTELGYRVHRPILLGHRGAARQSSYSLNDLRDQVLRDIERLGEVTLVGASLGAFVATTVATYEPGRVARLVLEELPVPPRDAQDGPPSRQSGSGLVLRLMGLLNRGRFDPVMLRQVVAELRAPRPQWWDALSSITARTLLLAGGGASHLDQSRFDLVAKVMPAATLTTIDVGHRIHAKAPDRWLAAVTDFLRSPRCDPGHS